MAKFVDSSAFENSEEYLRQQRDLYCQYHKLSDIRPGVSSYDLPDGLSFRWISINPGTCDPITSAMECAPKAEWAYCLDRERNGRNTVINPATESIGGSGTCEPYSLNEDDLMLIRNMKQGLSADYPGGGLVQRITHWLKAFDTSLKFDSPDL